MTGEHGRARWPIVLVVLLALVAAGAIALTGMVNARLASQRAGEGAVSAPSMPVLLDGEPRTGRFIAHLEFTSMAAPADAQVSTDVAWDDDWFFQDPTVYNHELATTCSVLSAIANSESAYYQAGSGAPAYMEDALAELGFEDVSTASYQYRSEVVDEVVNLLTNSTDVTAYTIASKQVTNSQTGQEKTLLLVSIRGSYGSEWLSDANMGDPRELDLAEADHRGFSEPANEVLSALTDRIESIALNGGSVDDVALLFCGHSRGAAAANLAASYADDYADSLRPLAPLDSIYAYTFACPRTTTMSNASDALYDNIWNVLNPADMVPRMPLATWGYTRFGHDLWLPEPGREPFDETYDAMRSAFRENVGTESPYEPSDASTVDYFEDRLAEDIRAQDEFESIGGVASVVRHMALDMNVMRVLYGHYPNVYIAWMQATSAEDLRLER